MVYPKEREKIFDRDDNTCKKCGKKLHQDLLRVDHILRPQEGGSGEMHNLQTLCRTCHFQKHIEHRERMKTHENLLAITRTIKLEPDIDKELLLIAAENNNATISEILKNLILVYKLLNGTKGKYVMQLEFWRGNGALFSISRFNDGRKKSIVYVQMFSYMTPRWNRIIRMTILQFQSFMRIHNLIFVGRIDI